MTLYEVYGPGAASGEFAGLPLLDVRCQLREAIAAANAWGGVVVRLEARVLSRWPWRREVLASRVVFAYRPPRVRKERKPLTVRLLRGKLNNGGRRPISNWKPR